MHDVKYHFSYAHSTVSIIFMMMGWHLADGLACLICHQCWGVFKFQLRLNFFFFFIALAYGIFWSSPGFLWVLQVRSPPPPPPPPLTTFFFFALAYGIFWSSPTYLWVLQVPPPPLPPAPPTPPNLQFLILVNKLKLEINGKARGAFVMLKSIWASGGISMRTKLCIFNSNVKSVLL